MFTRRQFLASLPALAATAAEADPFRLRYVLSSAMYGEMPLSEILPEVAKTGAESIDIWCKVHGNQREQIAEMGDEAFAELLKKNATKLKSRKKLGLPNKLTNLKTLPSQSLSKTLLRWKNSAAKQNKNP